MIMMVMLMITMIYLCYATMTDKSTGALLPHKITVKTLHHINSDTPQDETDP